MPTFFSKNKTNICYGFAMAGLLFVLKWLELRLIIIRNAYEIYIGLIAVIFTALGIWLAMKLIRPKTQTIIIEKEKPKDFIWNEAECARLNISKRELEVLELMASGLSNNEIADKLFLSTNTIKTHGAKIFEKLDVRRRTQAVEKAKQLGLIA
jgi:NarL family two-component system response regulator LiaR